MIAMNIVILGVALLLLFMGRVVLDVNGVWPASPVARRRWCALALVAPFLITVPIPWL